MLFALCIGSFLPTKELMNYVRYYIQQTIVNSTPQQKELRLLASLCNIRLQRTIINGVRKQPPSTLEIESVMVTHKFLTGF